VKATDCPRQDSEVALRPPPRWSRRISTAAFGDMDLDPFGWYTGKVDFDEIRIASLVEVQSRIPLGRLRDGPASVDQFFESLVQLTLEVEEEASALF
jgi:hypothetical protein